MKIDFLAPTVLLAAVTATGACRADITATVHRPAGDTSVVAASGAPITLTIDDDVTGVWIRADDPVNEDVGPITLTGSRNFPEYAVYVRSIDSEPTDPSQLILGRGCQDFAGISGNGTAASMARFTLAANGNITGAVTIGRIWRFQADGNVSAPITTLATDNWQADPSVFSTRFVVVAGSVNIGAHITSGGSIQRLDIGTPVTPPDPTAYKLNAKVVAANGKIGFLRVRGQINNTVRATHGIDSLDAYEITADITANYQNESGLPSPLHSGWIHSFLVRGPSESGVMLAGKVRANNAGDVGLDQGLGFGAITIEGPASKPMRFEGSAVAPIRAGSLLGSPTEPGLFVGVDLLNDVIVEGEADAIHIERDINPTLVNTLYINAGTSIGHLTVGGRIVGDCTKSVQVQTPLISHQLEVAGASTSLGVSSCPFRLGCISNPGFDYTLVRKVDFGQSVDRGRIEAQFYPGSGAITIQGNLTGSIYLPALPAVNLIQVGGGLVAHSCVPDLNVTHGRIHVPAGQLAGQIVVNANWTGVGEPGNPGGLWTGHVQDHPGTAYDITQYTPVCNVDISPYYYRSSGFLGGGAAGLVPYHLHHADCEPADTQLPPNCMAASGCDMTPTTRLWPDGSTRQTVVLRHYGPVFNTAASMPVRVWRASASNSCPTPPNCSGWTNVSTQWTYVAAPFGARREVWLARTSGTIDRRFQYLVEPVRDVTTATQLRSDDTLAPYPTPPTPYWTFFANVEGYPYRLYACNGSGLAALMDLNGSGDVEVGDVGEWVAEPADFTFDDTSDNEDLDLLVATVLNNGVPPEE